MSFFQLTGGATIDVLHPIPADSVIWQRADDIVGADGSSVAAWNNHLGNGNNFTQSTAGNKPILKTGTNGFNGHNIVRFDGVDDFLQAATIATSGKSMTVCAALKLTGDGTGETLMLLAPNDDWGPSGFGMFFYGNGGGGVNTQSMGLTYTGIPMGANPDLGNVKRWVAWRKDATGWTITSSGTANLTPADTNDIKLISPMIGYSPARHSGSGYLAWPGDLAELIVWERKLSNTELANVTANFVARYGI